MCRFNENILKKLSTFEISLKGMPEGTHKFEFTLDDDFFKEMQCADVQHGDVKVNLSVKHSGNLYYLEFDCVGTIFIPCNRCLDEMPHDVDATYDICVKFGERYDDSHDEVLIIPESENDFNVAPLIYDTVMLTIPITHSHAPGECNPEMERVLAEHEIFLSEEIDDAENENDSDNNNGFDPRWAELKKIIDNN